MTLVEKIRVLANEAGYSLPKLEEELGFGNGTISRWSKSSPSTEKLTKIADFFNVSLDYLADRDTSTLTENDEKDIAKTMSKIKKQLANEQGLMFDGEMMDEETIKLLLEEIERQERIVKAVNKKYIPKKYR